MHVMKLRAHLSHGTRVDHCDALAERCVLLLNLLRASTRQRLKHAEVIQRRWMETPRRAVLQTEAVPDTSFIYSEKFSALPIYPCVTQNPHPTLDGSLKSDNRLYFQYRQTLFPFGPMRNINWKLEYYFLPDKALYFLPLLLCDHGIKQEKIP